jgi:hypothetical protein
MTTNLTIPVDNEEYIKADSYLTSIGFDFTTYIQDFIHSLAQKAQISSTSTPKTRGLWGCMKGQIEIADDFDAPLDDFKDYM